MRAPEIEKSNEDERRAFIRQAYKCIGDCDMCGMCKVFGGKDPEIALDDYISGKRELFEVMTDYR